MATQKAKTTEQQKAIHIEKESAPEQQAAPPEVQESQSTAVSTDVMPDDVRADLLRAQQASITTDQPLQKITILPGEAQMFKIETVDEESGETSVKVPSFRGVILGAHRANSLWEHAFGEDVSNDEENLPLCASPDGMYGVPREGFAHIMLDGKKATGQEHILCQTCKYNKFGSGNMIRPNKPAKGKAVTNYSLAFIVISGEPAPLKFQIPSTSMAALDEYLYSLLRKKTPAMSVVTEFSLMMGKVGKREVAKAVFRNVGPLNKDVFETVYAKYQEFKSQIEPPVYVPTQEEYAANAPGLTRQQPSNVNQPGDFEDFKAEIDPSQDDLPF